jgi:predicted nucleic acid-binding protein
MILADSSVWIDHFKVANLLLSKALDADEVLMHPFVFGELALGSLRNRQAALANFEAYDLPPVVSAAGVLALIENVPLFNRGIGYIDANLLASCLVHGDCRLLTHDRRLREAAEQLGIAA